MPGLAGLAGSVATALRATGLRGGVALQGPGGCGKSRAARSALASVVGGAGGAVRELDPLEAGFLGGVEEDKALRRALEGAAAAGGACGCALLVDDAERWFGPGGSPALVLTMADLLREAAGAPAPLVVVLVLGESGALHPFLAGCVEEWVRAEMPSAPERLAVWHSALFECLDQHGLSDADVERANSSCHGWVQADILDVAHRLASERASAPSAPPAFSPGARLAELVARHEPLLFRAAGSSSGGGGQAEGGGAHCPWTVVPAHQVSTTWDSVAGLAETKQALLEMVVWPQTRGPELRALGVRAPAGVLLHGPPGTGKTLLAAAVAHECRANFITVAVPDVVKGLVGESEKALARVFAVARQAAPCVVFFDEFQAMFGDRESSGEVGRRLVSQFLLETDQRAEGVVLLASTNVPSAIDPALLRPGRFDRILEVPLPDLAARRALLAACRDQMASWEPDVAVEELAERTAGWSGAELDALCRASALEAVDRGKSSIGNLDFAAGISALLRCTN
jgi:hypothetical protein